MARLRSIKPDFFLHEGLAELSPLHRLFFIGLWTLADRDGLLEDRPKRIKAALLPWEKCDVEALLADLARAGFILRYGGGNTPCIAIPGFSKHQRPHPKEGSFGLPPPPVVPGKNTASREKTRLAITDATGIPSSPPFSGGGGGGGGGTLVSAPRVVQPSASSIPSAASELAGRTLLVERLVAEYRKERSGLLVIGRAEEALLAQLLTEKAGGSEDELVRRWSNALRWPTDYPAFAGLPGLQRHWDTYDQLPPSARGAGPPGRAPDIRRGVTRAEDQKHGTPGVSNAFD